MQPPSNQESRVFWVLFISVAVVVGVALILVQRQPVDRDLLGADPSSGQAAKYEQFRPLNEAHQALYWRLVEALPECVILPHVPFTRFMRPPAAGEKIPVRHYRAMNQRISQKTVDFLVCLRDFTVVAAVELDDRNAEGQRNLQRDELLKSAGIVPIRVYAEALPSVEALREMFTGAEK